MNRFSDLTQAVVFTPNEVALFYVLLHRWNLARRPAVIEQWAESTSKQIGMSVKVLRNARNKLAQKGVLFFDKKSSRAVPRYSLNALFGLPSPFIVSEKDTKRDTIRPLSGTLNGHHTGHSYQGKEKGEEHDKGEAGELCPSHLIPTLEQAQSFAKSDPTMIPPECVESWLDDRKTTGWEKVKGQSMVPIRDWRADLRGFGRNWANNRINRPSPKPSKPAKPVEGPDGWREEFRNLIANGPIPVQWDHVDPGLQGQIISNLKGKAS